MKGVSRCKQWLSKIFIGKKFLLSDKFRLRCPRCTSMMDKVQKKGVMIDVCHFCGGIFLDDGEIDKLQHFAKKKIAKPRKNTTAKKKTPIRKKTNR